MCGCGGAKRPGGRSMKWRVTVPSDPRLSKDFTDRAEARAYAVAQNVPTQTKAVQTREKV